MAEIELKVDGMVRRGNIVWMGCPDSIKAALEGLEEIEQVEYIIEEEKFRIKYRPSDKIIEQILDTIKNLGKERGRPYEPLILSP